MLSRRRFLATIGAGAGALALPGRWPQPARATLVGEQSFPALLDAAVNEAMQLGCVYADASIIRAGGAPTLRVRADHAGGWGIAVGSLTDVAGTVGRAVANAPAGVSEETEPGLTFGPGETHFLSSNGTRTKVTVPS